jgi:(+)-trans-carveol dehydrogenase
VGRLDGKVAVITGAARGQGRAHAIRFAREGADIIAIDICADLPNVPYPLSRPEDLAETVRLVRETGREILATQADVRDLEALTEALNEGWDGLGRQLDVVVANAGIGTYGAALDLTPAAWHEVIDVNLNGVWNTCRVALPLLIAGGRGGSIIMTNSVMGLKGCQNAAPYVTAKHGLVGMMRALALELAKHSIRVNSIHPTQVDTPMIQNPATKRLFVPDVDSPTREQFAAAAEGLNALPTPWVDVDDVCNAAVFLASEDARFVTGSTLSVDAGALLL